MRRWFALAWLIVPVMLLAYHYGPGQLRLARDRAARHLDVARAAESSEDWERAEVAYREALANLPEQDVDARLATRLAHAKVRPMLGQLPEAMDETDSLLNDAVRDSKDAKLINEIRSTAGTMHYHVAWLMRIEGADVEEWTEQTEAARQHFRLLAENAVAARDPSAEAHQKNLEAVIRLSRMDLNELKAKPLPKECNGNSNCSGKCRSQKASRNPAPKSGPKDVRQEIKTNAAGVRQRGSGGS